MLTRVAELLQSAVTGNSLGASALLVGWVLLICCGIGARWVLVHWNLRGEKNAVEWLMWTYLFTGVCLSVVLQAVVTSRSWDIEYAATNPVWYFATMTVWGFLFSVISVPVFAFFTFFFWNDAGDRAVMLGICAVDLALGAAVSTIVMFVIARLGASGREFSDRV
jgi:hypothetical protein